MKEIRILVQDEDLASLVAVIANLTPSFAVSTIDPLFVPARDIPTVKDKEVLAAAKRRSAKWRRSQSAPPPAFEPTEREHRIMKALVANGPMLSTKIAALARHSGDHSKHWMNTLATLKRRGAVVKEYDATTNRPQYRLSAKKRREFQSEITAGAGQVPDTVSATQ